MAEASDFKFATQLGFAKTHHKITQRKKRGWPWARELLKILGLPYDIFAMAGASAFEFDMQLEYAKSHHKTTNRGKVGVALGCGSSQIFGVPL